MNLELFVRLIGLFGLVVSGFVLGVLYTLTVRQLKDRRKYVSLQSLKEELNRIIKEEEK